MTSADALRAINAVLDLHFRGALDEVAALHAIAQITGATQ